MAGEWVAGAGEGRPIVVASNHHGLVETELLADPMGMQDDVHPSTAADGKHKVSTEVPLLLSTGHRAWRRRDVSWLSA